MKNKNTGLWIIAAYVSKNREDGTKDEYGSGGHYVIANNIKEAKTKALKRIKQLHPKEIVGKIYLANKLADSKKCLIK